MPASLVDADSLLAIDIGTINTRASFFDVVEGHYRFIASGQAASTATAPNRDIKLGVHQAIENLKNVTGRKFLDENKNLIMPATESSGTDTFAATYSAGPAINTAVVGLLDNVSMESTLRLARMIYARVVETIGVNDGRKVDEQIDSLVRLSPELILVSGGTDGGATRSVQHMLETVGLACFLLPNEKRPAMLFAGNQELAEEVKESFQPLTSSLRISPNLRPGIESENLQPAQHTLNELYNLVRRSQMNGVDELNMWAGNKLMPTAAAEGRIIRFLSQVYDSSKGILGIDLGASASTIAAAFAGELILGVYPQLGLGEELVNLFHHTTPEDIVKWIPLAISARQVREYTYQKSIHPESIPATPEDMAIEQALARQCLLLALRNASKDFPRKIHRVAPDIAPSFEPILAAGSVITRAPSLGQALLLLLDAIQPIGITTMILDQNNLLPALGAAASNNTILPIQVLESGAFLGLATVISPYANARFGTPILEARLLIQNGNESMIELKQGMLEAMPLPFGQSGRLYLHLLHNAELGLNQGNKRADGIPVSGTALGLVFDGRGRPLIHPKDDEHRREIIKKWMWTLGD